MAGGTLVPASASRTFFTGRGGAGPQTCQLLLDRRQLRLRVCPHLHFLGTCPLDRGDCRHDRGVRRERAEGHNAEPGGAKRQHRTARLARTWCVTATGRTPLASSSVAPTP